MRTFWSPSLIDFTEDKKMDNDPKSYHFLKETIKKEPPDWKKLLIRLALFFVLAALAGLVAAIVFAYTEPKFADYFASKEPPEKVALVESKEQNGTSCASSLVDAAAVSETGQSAEALDNSVSTAHPEETSSTEVSSSAGSEGTGTGDNVVTTESQENGTDGIAAKEEEKKEIDVDDYQHLYKKMLAVADKPKRALVTVTGITNQMDYFQQSYESEHQISGLVVADNGQDLFILTEYRVVENVERIQVSFWNSQIVDAIYQRHDGDTGLTILKVSKDKLDAETKDGLELAPLGSSYTVGQGDPVLALGSPIGYSDSVAYGVVTSVTNKVSTLDTEYNLLTTDILGSVDGSGVLVNLDGEIVGVIAQNYCVRGNNVVTALAISQIKQLIENLSNNVSRPYIGIKGQDVTDEISDKTGIPKGILITDVSENSPAMMAGIKEYDVIVMLDDHKTMTLSEYHENLGKYVKGDTLVVTALRKGAEGYSEMEFEVTVDEI